MLIIGLTGSMGMGKSTMASALRDAGLPVLDADAVVHDLYRGAAADEIEAAFPGTAENGVVDRGKLSAALKDNPAGFEKLEAIVHPLVHQAQRAFLKHAHDEGAKMAVLEIPLLFETGGAERVDLIIVVSASPDIQKARVMARPGMTEDKFNQLFDRQMPDAEKRKRADFVVDTGVKLEESLAQITDIVDQLRNRTGTVYRSYWNIA